MFTADHLCSRLIASGLRAKGALAAPLAHVGRVFRLFVRAAPPAAALSTRRPCVLTLGNRRTRAVVPPSFHGFSFGGAKARTAAFHPEILQFVVRRLRTTHRKFSLSDSTVCAFAPLEKRPRSVVPRDGESCIIVHHDESPCMTHGGAEMLVLHLVENVCVIPWPLVWWCKGTYGGA